MAALYLIYHRASKQLSEGVKDNLEGCFYGNICRCTGYRQIMHAMQQCVDIEVRIRDTNVQLLCCIGYWIVY